MFLTFPDVAEDVAALAVAEDETVSGLAVPFGIVSHPSALDGRRYVFATGPSNADDLVDVVREHDDDAPVGRLAAPWQTTETGARASVRFYDTTGGRDARVEAREGVRRGFSVKALIRKFTERADGVREVTEWTAAHLGMVRRPALPGAGVEFTTAATIPTEKKETNAMPQNAPTVDNIDLTPEQIAELAEQVGNMPTVAELAEQVAGHLNLDNAPAHPLAAFATAADFYAEYQDAHARNDTETTETLAAAFAVPDQTIADNPGLTPPAWRTDIKKRVDKRTPALRAFGTLGLPGTGMSVDWPFLDPALDIDAIVSKQTAEKAELQGVKINIKKGSATIATAGAVSDISYQLLMRGAPSYLAAHNEILLAAFARYLEAQFEAQLVALGTDTGQAAPTTEDALRARLFELSAQVEDVAGSPADTVLVSTDLWSTYGGFSGLHNPKYGTQNVAGTSSARTLEIDVNGLRIERAPFLPAATMLVSSSDAAKGSNSGPKIATAEDVRKLGRDVAVWGMYTPGEVYFPSAVLIDTPQV